MALCDVEAPGFFLSRPFFGSTFTWHVHALIEWKLVLNDLVSKYGLTLIKLYYIRRLMFLYSFYIGNISGTLGVFFTCSGRLRK